MKEDEIDKTCSILQCCSVKEKTLRTSRHHFAVAVESSRALQSLRNGVADPYVFLRNWKTCPAAT